MMALMPRMSIKEVYPLIHMFLDCSARFCIVWNKQIHDDIQSLPKWPKVSGILCIIVNTFLETYKLIR
jgi:hypothetical protein